ncbi:hypothetical protein G3I60_08170 [Streptomyces sp. SID13666]|nr:hypothetical protein [Streptomyces sp. SID13666]NEA70226.1 hypothetical protein [Streptomyces sp. SID13588]
MHGVALPELDLGGGHAVPYGPGESALDITTLADRIRHELADGCARSGLPLPRLTIEPGRAVVGPAGVALYDVVSVKRSAHGFATSRPTGRRWSAASKHGAVWKAPTLSPLVRSCSTATWPTLRNRTERVSRSSCSPRLEDLHPLGGEGTPSLAEPVDDGHGGILQAAGAVRTRTRSVQGVPAPWFGSSAMSRTMAVTQLRSAVMIK